MANSKDTGTIPPQNIEAEKSLLGCLMIDQDAIFKVADFLQIKDFYKPIHQDIFECIVELFAKREPVDLLSVSSKLSEYQKLEVSGGASYLTDLINVVPTASNVLHYAKIVQEKRVLRDLISAGYDISNLALQEAEAIDVLLDKAEKRIFAIAQKSLSQSFTQVKDTLEETWKRIEDLSKQKGALRGIPTGFRDLDNKLAGLQRADLVILAARPSIGKSAMAIDIAKNVACKYKIPVGIFSLEMSKDQIVDRLISAQADVDLWRIRTGKLSDQGPNNDFERIQKAMAELAEAPLYIDDVSSSNVIQMRAMARRLAMDKGLGLLIIDYLQLMEGRGNTDNIVQQVSENSRALKGIAKELNIPVLVLSQLSRAVEHRMPPIPRLSDLRESGCLTGDTLITRADTGERIPIKDLVGQTDIPVHSLDFDFKIKEKLISKVFSTGEKMVYELTTRSGFKIKASSNHPFWRIDGWKRLEELKVGDKIATPAEIKISKPKNELTENEIILLAHLLGDGCILPRQPYHYTSADWGNIKIVEKTAKELFSINSKIIKQKNWWHIYLTSPYHLTHNKQHPITKWFETLGIQRVRSYEKEIPQKVFSLDNERLALFLKHLWATDGNISLKPLRNKQTQVSIYYSSTSYQIAQSVKSLLLKFGIRSKISEKHKANYRICYTVSVYGKEHQLRFLELIGCYGERGEKIPQFIEKLNRTKSNTNLDVWPKETWKFIIDPIRKNQGMSWRDFSKGIETQYCGDSLFKNGISAERMARIANTLQSPALWEIAKADIFWDEIVEIKKLKIETVYDLTVPGTHNFVANGIIAENSIEQDADVVMFIYREDKYKPNTERKNVAEIIIAKHRNGPTGKIDLYFDETRATFRDLEKGAFSEEPEPDEESII